VDLFLVDAFGLVRVSGSQIGQECQSGGARIIRSLAWARAMPAFAVLGVHQAPAAVAILMASKPVERASDGSVRARSGPGYSFARAFASKPEGGTSSSSTGIDAQTGARIDATFIQQNTGTKGGREPTQSRDHRRGVLQSTTRRLELGRIVVVLCLHAGRGR